MINAQIIVSDSLKRKLDPQTYQSAIKTGAVAVLKEIAGEVNPYPPLTAANRPGRFTPKGRPLGYYERNRGYWSPRTKTFGARFYTLDRKAKFGKAYSAIKASSTQRRTGTVAGYVLTSHSDHLGRKWIIKPLTNGAMLVNSASYAGFVQSAQRQSSVMRQIGWKTDLDAVNKVVKSGLAAQIIRDAIMAKIKR